MVVLSMMGSMSVPLVAQQNVSVTEPRPGTTTRRALLDAMRRKLKARVTFKVAHMAVAGNIAFVRAGEIVQDGTQWQETDLFVEALLERPTARGRWRVVEFWNLQSDPQESHAPFVQRVREALRSRSRPLTLLPEDLRAP